MIRRGTTTLAWERPTPPKKSNHDKDLPRMSRDQQILISLKNTYQVFYLIRNLPYGSRKTHTMTLQRRGAVRYIQWWEVVDLKGKETNVNITNTCHKGNGCSKSAYVCHWEEKGVHSMYGTHHSCCQGCYFIGAKRENNPTIQWNVPPVD